ncbi:MAG: hypothetical protein M0P52_00255 [Rhodoferax sp.]|jgi:hypothetical protein|nr:hypothetical protein [Rhodoferax sp.]
MQITLDTNTAQLQEALKISKEQLPYAMMLAINKVAEQGRSDVQTKMKSVFDRPTAWVINSIRIKYATKTALGAALAFKDRNSVESSRTMVEPHVYAGQRHYKTMEARLWRANYLPQNYNVVPGAGATLDAYGNMSAGQISQILNVLGTYTEAGYNTANSKTVTRLAKGTKKTYGFTYWVNRVGSGITHLPPGVYKRVYTAWGTSLVPMLIFVRRAKYKEVLDFYGISRGAFDRHFPGYFDTAFQQAMKTALLKDQGALF